jgi:hypothetical protein
MFDNARMGYTGDPGPLIDRRGYLAIGTPVSGTIRIILEDVK